MKNCINCFHARITESIKSKAESLNTKPENLPFKYCLERCDFVQNNGSCGDFKSKN